MLTEEGLARVRTKVAPSGEAALDPAGQQGLILSKGTLSGHSTAQLASGSPSTAVLEAVHDTTLELL